MKINEMLECKGVPQYFQVMAVGYLVAGNIKITTTHTCKASDLITFGEDIAAIITKNKVISVLLDKDHYRIKINVMTSSPGYRKWGLGSQTWPSC